MLVEHFKPRFCETDALGHINNVSYSAWVEQSRTSLLMDQDQFAMPDGFNFVLANINMDFLAEGYFGESVCNSSWINKVGRSSIQICTKITQAERLLLKATSTLVFYDLSKKQTCELPKAYKEAIFSSPCFNEQS